MSARQESTDETDDLRRVVEGVPGVVSADVEVDQAGRPRIRVHLDGTRAQEFVLESVRGAVAAWRLPDGDDRTAARGRRAGLGKGLDSLLAEALKPAAHPATTDAILSAPALVRVSVVRGEHGASVQATDTMGTMAVVFVSPEGVEAAAVAAIATLRDQPTPVVLAASVAPVGGHDVATVVLEGHRGEVLAGSAPAGRDRLLAIGLAAWRALDS